MNGSGVGRAYDDDMCVVDWDNMPSVRSVISSDHPAFFLIDNKFGMNLKTTSHFSGVFSPAGD